MPDDGVGYPQGRSLSRRSMARGNHSRLVAVETFVERVGGAARRRHLLNAGFADRDVARALKSGALIHPHRGCVALPGAPRDVIRATVLSGQLTCLSAARRLGLPVMENWSDVHVAVHEHRGFGPADPRLRGVRLHRVAAPADGAAFAPVLDVIDHVGLCAGRMTQLAAADAALRRGLIEPERLWSLTATDVVRRTWLARMADGRADSPAETFARVELVEAGFDVTPQALIEGVGHVDFQVEGFLVVEVDGYGPHSTREAFEEDHRREQALELLGIPRLRFTYRDSVLTPGKVARIVAARLNQK